MVNINYSIILFRIFVFYFLFCLFFLTYIFLRLHNAFPLSALEKCSLQGYKDTALIPKHASIIYIVIIREMNMSNLQFFNLQFYTLSRTVFCEGCIRRIKMPLRKKIKALSYTASSKQIVIML